MQLLSAGRKGDGLRCDECDGTTQARVGIWELVLDGESRHQLLCYMCAVLKAVALTELGPFDPRASCVIRCQHPALKYRMSQGTHQLATHKTASKSTPNSNSFPILLMDAVTSFGGVMEPPGPVQGTSLRFDHSDLRHRCQGGAVYSLGTAPAVGR